MAFNQSRQCLFFELNISNFLMNTLFYFALKCLHLLFYILVKCWKSFKGFYLTISRSSRWWSLPSMLIESNINMIVLYSGMQLLIFSSENAVDKLNMMSVALMLFSAFMYSLAFYPLVYAFETKGSAKTLLIHSNYNHNSFFFESLYFMFRGCTRSLIHSLFMRSYRFQIITLTVFDLVFIFLSILYMKSFAMKSLFTSMLIYQCLFFVLDLVFSLHDIKSSIFDNFDY